MKLACAIAAALIPGAALAAPPALGPVALDQGSDAIVEGEVVSVESAWLPDRSGIETRIEIAVSRTVAGEVPATLTLVEPGGVVDGATHQIAGMPRFVVGQRARLNLRRLGPAEFRVYGWERGVQPLPGGVQADFTHNGMRWEPGQIPVEFRVDPTGSDDLDPAVSRAAIVAAFDTWEAVPCSTLAFADGGDSDLDVAIDGVNVVKFIESGWIYGEEAAGATSLFFLPGETPTADVALNGENFSWADGVPSVGPATQDVQGVMTHELGHFSGLGHSTSSVDTMYFSWTPWQGQRILSADDKHGLCELYPKDADECDVDDDCGEGFTCEPYPHGTLCAPIPDPLGAPCDYDRIECARFCLFTAADLSRGYCSRFCDETPCPPGFECMDASAGEDPVRVCFVGAACAEPNFPCPAGRFCGDDGICTFECREDIDCAGGGTCDPADGRCVDAVDDGGCGCASGGGGAGGNLLLILLVAALVRRTRLSPRAAR